MSTEIFHFDESDISEIRSGKLSDDAGLTREISVRTYRTSHRFNRVELLEGLEAGKLPKLGKFGKVETFSAPDDTEIRVVLARQEETRVRTWDAGADVVRWWKWEHTIVDTVAVRYWADEEGYLRFMTLGGGRIKFPMIETFHYKHLAIERGTSDVVAIDPFLLRARCFAPEFVERLHAIKARVPKKGYESIDHAAYTSRLYMKPEVDRLKDIRDDPKATVEAFDSVVEAETKDVKRTVLVRFVVSAGSASIRLRFPRVYYQDNLKSLRSQTKAFYQLCEEAVRRIVGPGLTTTEEVDPTLLDGGGGLLARWMPTGKHELWLSKRANRKAFLDKLDVYEEEASWLPNLRALDVLLRGGDVEGLAEDLGSFASADPWQAAALLDRCRTHALARVGHEVAVAVASGFGELRGMDTRARCDDAILAWAAEHEESGWAFEPDSDRVTVLGRSLQFERIEPRLRSLILLRCARSLHAGLIGDEVDADALSRLHWTLQRAAQLPFDDNAPLAGKLLAGGNIPGTPSSLSGLFSTPLANLDDVTRAAWAEAELPLWPLLEITTTDTGERALTNLGFGGATVLRGGGTPVTLATGESCPWPGGPAANTPVAFMRLGVRHTVRLAVGAVASQGAQAALAGPPPLLSRAQIADLRREIDPDRVVVGEHDAIYDLFYQMWVCNTGARPAHAFLLGETGTGKTHVAKLLHRASTRHRGPFYEATHAASPGGSEDVMRAEWVGAAPKSGVAGMPEEGRRGHLLLAKGGTLFIDDCERLPEGAQQLLLAATDENPGVLNGVGGLQERPDVRVIFATNHDLDQLVADKKIRPDLRFRAPHTLRLPTLRERRTDIVLLARHFANAKQARLLERALVALVRFDWPGNVRQLREVVEAGADLARALSVRTKAPGPTAARSDVLLDHLHLLPVEHRSAVAGLTDDEVSTEFWRLVAGAAGDAGAEPHRRHAGLNARMAELSGYDKSHVSRMYRRWVLGITESRPPDLPPPWERPWGAGMTIGA